MMKYVIAAVAAAAGLGVSGASAQTPGPFEVGVQIPIAHIDELDSTDVGIGVRAAWRGLPLIGVEGEINFFPSDIPDQTAITGNRVEGLFGVTVGPQINRWRPFVRFRPGFLNVGESPEPVACPLIFPPTLSCTLAAGGTFLTLDVGGGVEVAATSKTFVRFDIGDRMVKYPGPAIDRSGESHDDDFFGQDLRLAIGAGWRF
jgi:hypothetical protein